MPWQTYLSDNEEHGDDDGARWNVSSNLPKRFITTLKYSHDTKYNGSLSVHLYTCITLHSANKTTRLKDQSAIKTVWSVSNNMSFKFSMEAQCRPPVIISYLHVTWLGAAVAVGYTQSWPQTCSYSGSIPCNTNKEQPFVHLLHWSRRRYPAFWSRFWMR